MLENESRENGVIAAAAWARLRDLCSQEADALDGALARLAERWPLTQPAAVAFQEWGTQLVMAMRRTAHAAAVNGPTLDSITHDIDLARRKVSELLAEAREFQRAQDLYGSNFANRAFHERYIGGEPWLAALTLSWQTGLNLIAQQLMADLEVAIDTNAARFVIDDPYVQPRPSRTYPDTSQESAPDFDASSTGGRLGDEGAGLRWAGQTMLDGSLASPGSATVSASADEPRTGPPAWGTGEQFVDTPVGRVLAPGGVLGAPATGGQASASLPGSARQVGPGTIPIVPPMATNQGIGTGSATSERRTRRGRRSVFEVPEGVPAVIVPPQEPPSHDPGPGVIGIDR